MKWYYLLHPRPAYIIGSGSGEEVNIMAASWVTPISMEPPTVGVVVDEETYTADLIKKYKQYTINIVENLKLIMRAGSVSGREANKLEGVKWERGKKVDSPVLEEAVGWIEAKVINEVKVGEVYLFVGEVVHWEARRGFDRYGWRLGEVKIPLHKAGKAFVFPSAQVHVVR